MTDQVLDAIVNNDQLITAIKGGGYLEEARAVLEYMQKRDYRALDRQMDMAKDVIYKDASFGRLALTIPDDHYSVLKLIYPDLIHPEGEVKTKAWKAFCLTDESLPYKINKKLRKM